MEQLERQVKKKKREMKRRERRGEKDEQCLSKYIRIAVD